jgi:hypothetical protein
MKVQTVGRRPAAPDSTEERIAAVAAGLRKPLAELLSQLAGAPPRPVRLIRGIGLDKSLASRLVQATRAESDLQFLHAIPSPTGLRMLLDRAGGQAEASLIRRARGEVDRFEALLDALPGGRQALDARMGERLSTIRIKREQMARQASFKAVSFLFGHYCETLTTALFLVPSKAGNMVDAIEVHRRIGLQRLASGTPLPLLSLRLNGDEPLPDDAPYLTSLAGDAQTRHPRDYLIGLPAGAAPPPLEVVQEDDVTTFVLAPGSDPLPGRLTTAYRVMNIEPRVPSAGFSMVRNYMLHTPCRLLVREVYLAKGLWNDARPEIGFYLPGPSGTPMVQCEPGKPHLRRVNLTAPIEQLPTDGGALALPEVQDQREVLEAVLAATGLRAQGFRGWRCRMAYPVPLIEMQVAFVFNEPGRPD